jgi:circadian clock protein KaiC
MGHSNQIREFVLTDRGVELKDVYVGPEGVLTGSMRLAQEAKERAAAVSRQQEIERRQRELERKRQALQAQIDSLSSEFHAEEEELKRLMTEGQAAQQLLVEDRARMAASRKADASSGHNSDDDKREQ